MESTAGVADLAQRLQRALGDEYEVNEPLGSGGFAVVFCVREAQLKRDLAVKVLSDDIVASKTAVARFRREAATVAQLSHPNIVPLHFVGNRDDIVYIAMQCVTGGSLADRVQKEGALPVADVERYLVEISSALAHAHRHGVVHRDIKPHNVLLDAETGRSLVTDFGIARTDDNASLTATGMVLGTPTYLAPEQVTGEPSDHRADIYALGVMTYELLAGKPPFEGATPTAVLMKRLGDPPPHLTTTRPDVPKLLADVVAKCLMTDPEARFQNAGEIAKALTGQTPQSGTRSLAQLTKPTKSRTPIVAGVGAALLVAVAAVLLLRPRPNEKPLETAPVVVRPAVDSNMALIPAGDYPIGSKDSTSDAYPEHSVRLGAFGLEKHEVTVGEYKKFVDATRTSAPWMTPAPAAQLPVTRVLWSEAQSYCAWAHPDGGRLPTEEEWEAAARGVEGHIFPWGDKPDNSAANTAAAGRGRYMPVGSFPRGATAEGVEDMIGNVWEWTSSPRQAYPGGTAMADTMSSYRIIRGGAFNSAIATTWNRGYSRPRTSPEELKITGFRCAMTARSSALPAAMPTASDERTV